MALRLQIVSDHQQSLGERSSIVFGVGGGSIGRARDNDWVLPDPQRFLSGHHARVHFRQGAFYLEDMSTNGVFVNGSDTPIAAGGAYALRHGDTLRFGDYEISVVLDEAQSVQLIAKDPSGVVHVDNVTPLHPPGRVQQDDIGASLNVEALITSGAPTEEGFAPIAGYDLRFEGDDEENPPRPGTAARRIADFRSAVRQRRERRETEKQGLSGIQAFCKGAGIDAEKLPSEHGRLLQLAGQLLRETVVGMADLRGAQDDQRKGYQVELPAEDAERARLAKLAADELLVALFNGHEKHEVDAVLWLREGLRNARHHDLAAAQALRAAFADFVIRLDPRELESRFKRADRARNGSGDPEERWSSYREIYRNLTQMPNGNLPHLFAETFAQAYLQELRTRQDGGKSGS